MSPRTKDWIYRVTPIPVLRQTLPRLRPERTPFKPHVVSSGVIFVHVPKTAGTSLKTELYGNIKGGHHRSIAEFSVYDPERTRTFFKCAFVRNPWDRLLSAYSFLTQGVGTTDRDDDFAREALTETPDFESFVLRLRDRRFRARVGHYDHFRTQAFWICMPGQRTHRMDFLGRFETVKEDLTQLREQLGQGLVSPAATPAAAGGVAMIHNRPSAHAPYRSAYTDQTRDVVADVYARDISLLGYSF